jgi:hypothetical protein
MLFWLYFERVLLELYHNESKKRGWVIKTGIIEGFYGRPWSFETRKSTVSWMASKGMDFYLYCPKADKKLRENWQESWTEPEFSELKSLRDKCEIENIEFGVGLSPFEIYKNWNQKNKKLLRVKIEEINQLKVNTLAILFDDMEGDRDKIGRVQAEIAEYAFSLSNAQSFQVCPTWYTYAPEIKALFGEMPKDYLNDLGVNLDKKVNIFWSGPRVCSQEYTVEHLSKVSEVIKRKPLIWDNNPVNDGVRMAPFLHLKPVNRLENIKGFTAGIGFNPMVEPLLSRLPIARDVLELGTGSALSLAEYKQIFLRELGLELGGDLFLDHQMFNERGVGSVGVLGGAQASLKMSRRIFSSKGWSRLSLDEQTQIKFWQSDFECRFSKSFDELEIEELIKKYRAYANPVAQELVAWLRGKFAFDPNCLT